VDPAKLSFTMEERIKPFHNKQKLKEFMTSKPASKQLLKGILHRGEEDRHSQESMRKNNPY
jgi:hypothetical protein